MKIINKTITIIITAALLTLAGCQSSTPRPTSAAQTEPLKQSNSLINNLSSLPAVKSVSTWDNEFSNGIIISTKHYQIYTTLLDPLMLQQVPGFVESAYQAYQKQLPTQIETNQPFKIYLFQNRQQWEQFTKQFVGPNYPVYLKIEKGAYYLNGSCITYNIGRTHTFSVLAHEAWHQFNSRLFTYRLPSWLDEGLAMSFESFTYKDGWYYFDPAQNIQRLGGLRQTITKNKMIPLRQLIALNPGQVVANDNIDSVVAFYSQSYALVRFLKEENYGKRLANTQRMLMGSANGTWPLNNDEKNIAANRNIPLTADWNSYVAVKLFDHYFNEEFNTLENEYLRFCKKIVYHVRVIKK